MSFDLNLSSCKGGGAANNGRYGDTVILTADLNLSSCKGGGAANNGRYGDTVILTARRNASPPTLASVDTWAYAAQTRGRYGDTGF